jgi:hypothetical protein
MSRLDELEASLRASWDRDVLAVYADELQATGELRGELITIDLRIEDVGPDPELVARRKELLAQWLATLPPGKVTHGFVDVDASGANPVEQIRTAFASPAAPYIRTVLIAGPSPAVSQALREVAGGPRVGLVRLVVRQWSAGKATTIGLGATEQLFDALPDLDTLELDGYRICGDVAHPNVRRARISGANAIESLRRDTLCQWDALTELDFAFGSHIGGPVQQLRTSVLSRSALPALRRLDLSRNYRGFLDPDHLGGDVDLVSFIRQIKPAMQGVEITLPIYDAGGK